MIDPNEPAAWTEHGIHWIYHNHLGEPQNYYMPFGPTQDDRDRAARYLEHYLPQRPDSRLVTRTHTTSAWEAPGE